MSWAITFWSHEHLGDQWYPLSIAAHLAAERIGATVLQLEAAFRAWAEAGEPENFSYAIREEEGSRGRAHQIFICIDEYLGLNSMNKEISGWGWIYLSRSWGTHKRMISNSVKFSREILL